jgi:hypothetical protein
MRARIELIYFIIILADFPPQNTKDFYYMYNVTIYRRLGSQEHRSGGQGGQ